MTSELKPCPFCGEEHISVAYTGYEDEGCVLHTVGCSTSNCPGHIAGSWRYFNRERAVEAWNRRAEHTCSIEDVTSGYTETNWGRCSSCGEKFPYQGDVAACPCCGAKVKEER